MVRRPRKLTACNCSICRRYGAMWAYFQRKSVKVVCNPGELRKYIWGSGALEFYRCKSCGCVTHHERSNKRADATDIRAVNMRNIDDPAIISRVPIKLLDGAHSWQVLEESVQPNLLQSPPGQ